MAFQAFRDTWPLDHCRMKRPSKFKLRIIVIVHLSITRPQSGTNAQSLTGCESHALGFIIAIAIAPAAVERAG